MPAAVEESGVVSPLTHRQLGPWNGNQILLAVSQLNVFYYNERRPENERIVWRPDLSDYSPREVELLLHWFIAQGGSQWFADQVKGYEAMLADLEAKSLDSAGI